MSEELIEELARAIIGPRKALPEGSAYSLKQLQDIRWGQSGDDLRKDALWAARALLPIIRRRELEAGEKVKEAIFAQTDPRCDKCDYAYAALDVAAIIGDSHD